MSRNRRQKDTLQSVFEDPVRSDVRWTDVEGLLGALGAEVSEGRGSRIRFCLRGERAVFHRPHSRPETNKGALRSIRRFLKETGIEPED